MARWQPGGQDRLVAAALDLFAERGYERTTVAEIAQRAGLTKSTFFRHFADKREVLFGAETLTDLLAQGVAQAPAEADALEAVGHALTALGREVFTADRHAFVARRREVIAASPELQEREALKAIALTATIAAALQARGEPELTARVAAQLGTLILADAHERWIASSADDAFDQLARKRLRAVRATCADL